jgi:predicted transcriptional regulator
MFEVPFKMYFYEKLGNLKNIQKVGYTEYRHEGRGRVVGECICHAVKSVDMNQMDFALETALQMKTRDISKLLDGENGYVFFFKSVKEYKNPIPLEAFEKEVAPSKWYRVKDKGKL